MACSTNVNDFFRNFTVVSILNEFVVNEFNMENPLSRPFHWAGFSATTTTRNQGSLDSQKNSNYYNPVCG